MIRGLLNAYGAGMIAFALIFGPAAESKAQRLAAMSAAFVWPAMVYFTVTVDPKELMEKYGNDR
ncbi:hypothetical protein P67b_00030 [Ruegeria phage Tedan]|nr:hypothetical protein P67b_00030 [Ruegeria phage Tedan]